MSSCYLQDRQGFIQWNIYSIRRYGIRRYLLMSKILNRNIYFLYIGEIIIAYYRKSTCFLASSINLISGWELQSSSDQIFIYQWVIYLNEGSTGVHQPQMNGTWSFSGTVICSLWDYSCMDTCMDVNQKLSCKQPLYFGFCTFCSVRPLEN